MSDAIQSAVAVAEQATSVPFPSTCSGSATAPCTAEFLAELKAKQREVEEEIKKILCQIKHKNVERQLIQAALETCMSNLDGLGKKTGSCGCGA